jgi:tetratricopeptide (TPR) repeat protein
MKDPGDPHYRSPLGTSVLMGAAILAYHNSFVVPFLLDDHESIVENATIRRLWPPWDAFSPPVGEGITVGGRPLLNFTLALNHALSGAAVWSYHAFNLLIHVLAALTLRAVLQRTFARLPWPVSGQAGATWIPLAVSLLWLLHPLQTQAVTYIVQRAESMVSLFYLLTLYTFIRAVEPGSGRAWPGLSVAACLLGMMTKEVMVSAPLLVLWYDRTFVAGTVRAAWQARGRYYTALFGTWLVLAYLVAGAAGRGGTVGSSSDMPWPDYALTQCAAIIHYLRLVFWPSPLVFDYGTEVVRSPADISLQIMLLGALVIGVVLALWRRPAVGFLGASFFALLAPSSSVVPVATQTVSEHRMYLALAPVLVFAAVGARRWLGRRAVPLLACLAVVAGFLTVRRNGDYQTALSIWQDTVQKRPLNARAQNNYGQSLFFLERYGEALPAFREAVRLAPLESEVYHFNLGLTLDKLGRGPESLPHYQEAARLRPRDAELQMKLAVALGGSGRLEEAGRHFGAAVALQPGYPEALYRWGVLLHSAGQAREAIRRLDEAIRSEEDYGPAWTQKGLCLASIGQHDAAIESLERALQLNPGQAGVHFHLAESWFAKGNFPLAAARYHDALQLDPGNPGLHHFHGIALAMAGRTGEAAAAFERAVQLKPDYAEASLALARARSQMLGTNPAGARSNEASSRK